MTVLQLFCVMLLEMMGFVNYTTSTAGIILGMGSANERRRHDVMSSLIGRAHTQHDPWYTQELYDKLGYRRSQSMQEQNNQNHVYE